MYSIDSNLNKEYQENLITFFELDNFLDYQISELSTGFVKRVKLLASMLHSPTLFIWDEPFSGLDKNFSFKLLEKIIELSNQNKCFLISSHILQMVNNLNFHEKSEFEIVKGKIICD